MEQPTHCIVRKVVWGILLGFGVVFSIIGIYLLVKAAGGNSSIATVIFVTFGPTALVVACGIIPWAFEPELDKMRKQRELYKKQQGKDIEAEYYSVDADIHSRAIKKRTRALTEGIRVEKCPKCGDNVDSNENFCNKCGTEIYKKCTKCKTVNQAGDEFCRNCGNKL